jgi:hypothetical protein
MNLTNEQMMVPLAMALEYLPEADKVLEWDIRDHDEDGTLDIGCRAPGGDWVWHHMPRDVNMRWLQRNVQDVVDGLRFKARGLERVRPG